MTASVTDLVHAVNDLVPLVAPVVVLCLFIAGALFIVFAWRSLARISRQVTEMGERMKLIEDDLARAAAARAGGPPEEADTD